MGRQQLPDDGAPGRNWESVEEIGRAFDEAWQSADGPPLEYFLPPPTHPLRRSALVRLAAVDVDWQWRSARTALVESFLAAWPELRTDDSALCELLAAECLARATYAALPDVKDLLARFPTHVASLDFAAIERQAAAARRDRSYLGSERFFLLRQVGKGGMGVVFAALDRQRNEVVALKALPVTRPESLYYFKQEFRNLSEIVHPHLAAPYELLSIGGQWFFTMELIDGVGFITSVRFGQKPASPDSSGLEVTRPLNRYGAETGAFTHSPAEEIELRRPPEVNYSRLRELLRQMADALDALHRRGILHRDLKPSNVMVRRGGDLVVLDFGLSTHLAAQAEREASSPADVVMSSSISTFATTERKLAGTVAYMSPEQSIGLPLTEVSDWYSVGVMLYLALAGRLPFTGPAWEIGDQKRLCLPPDPREFNAEIPDDLQEICWGLLEREARDRWNSDKVRQRLGAAANLEHEAEPALATAPIPFVGREEQLADLDEAYREMTAGATVCVHVCGSSGAGKSRLVSHFLRSSLAGERAIVLTGRCYESESAPYKGLDTIIDSLCRFLLTLPHEESEALVPPEIGALARMFPVLARVDAVAATLRRAHGAADAQQLRRRAFAALRELLHRLGNVGPLVLAIDDLQWGDVDSAAVLAELLRPPGLPRMLLIAAYRSEYRGETACLELLAAIGQADASDAAEACAATALAERSSAPAAPTLRRDVFVGPLSQDESLQMASRLLGEGEFGPARAGAIARQAQGSPYFILEMAEHARSGGELGATAADLDLDAVLHGRLQRLAAPARRLLEVVAIAGQPLAQRTALQAAEIASAASAHVAALRSQHLLRTHGPGLDDPLSAYHDRIRESVVAHLPPAVLTDHHTRLARALEHSQRADAEQIARHFDAAGELERAGSYYASAADEAASKLAFDRAARLYRRSLDLLNLEASQRRTLLTRCADALANAGRGREAALCYLTAAEGATGQEAFELRRRAAYQFCISGHVDQGRAALAELLGAVGVSLPRTPGRALAALLANRLRLFLRGTAFTLRSQDEIEPDSLHRVDVIWTAAAGLSMFDLVAGADFQTRGCLLALKTGEPFRLARALAWEAAHVSNLGGSASRRSQRLLDEARRLAHQVADPYARGWTELCEGVVNFTSGRWRIARTLLEHAAGALRSECTGVAWELNTAHNFILWSLFYLGELAQMRGRSTQLLAEARDHGDRYAEATLGAFCVPMSHLVLDDPAAAHDAIEEALGQWTQAGFHVQHFIALMGHTYVDLYCGRSAAACRRLEEQWPLARRSQLLRAQVLRSLLTALRGRAALACARDSASPGPLLRAARRDAQRLLKENMPYCTAQSRHLMAGVALLEGDRSRAVGLLEQTVRGYEECEMRAMAAAVRCRLGELRADDQGQQMTDHALGFFLNQGVADAGRFIEALAVIPQPSPSRHRI